MQEDAHEQRHLRSHAYFGSCLMRMRNVPRYPRSISAKMPIYFAGKAVKQNKLFTPRFYPYNSEH